MKTFSLTHDAEGVRGDEIKMAFTLKVQQPASADIIATLGVKSETEGLDANQISLSLPQVTLKAGQIISEEITATVDPEIFADIMEKSSFSFSVSISNIATTDGNTVISSNLRTLPVTINKAAFLNLKTGTPPNLSLIHI